MNIDALKKMLAAGQDNLLLRFGLGKALLDAGDAAEAIDHFRKALEFDPKHSASWKFLGKACALAGHPQEAINAYTQGIALAESKGDIQAAKEMKVFLKRLLKNPAQ
jgi:Flp pilus assembly protein TadD